MRINGGRGTHGRNELSTRRARVIVSPGDRRSGKSSDNWRAAQDRIEEANALFTIGLLYIEIGDRASALRTRAKPL